VGKPLGKQLLGRLRRWKNCIKLDVGKDKRLQGMATKYHKYETSIIHHILVEALLKHLTSFACIHILLLLSTNCEKDEKEESTAKKRVSRDAEAKVTNILSIMVFIYINYVMHIFITYIKTINCFIQW
jgi:hypothetical protein